MKWLFWSYYHPATGIFGGAEFSAHKTAEMMSQRDDVSFMYVKQKGQKGLATPYTQIGLKYYPYQEWRKGANIVHKTMLFGFNVCSQVFYLSKLYMIMLFTIRILEARPNIVYCSNSSRYVAGIMLICKMARIPVLLRVVGGDLYWRKQVPGTARRVQMRFVNWLNFTKANKVICFTKTIERDVRKQRRCARTVVIPDGVNTRKFKPLRKQKIILYVGRKCYPKRFDIVEDAFNGSYLWWQGEDYRLECIQGGIPPDEMPKRYGRAKIFCFASESEGFPLVFAEAMACGTPIVTNRFRGVEDIIKSGYNGYVCDSSREMSALLTFLVSAKGAYKTMQKNCLKEANGYDWAVIAGRIREEAQA